MLLSSQPVLISAIVHAFVLIFAVTLVLNAAVYVFVDPILHFFQIPTCAQQSAMNFGILLVQRLSFPALWSESETYRAVERPGMSLILTIFSLGTRAVLAYALAGPVGEVGIWAAIPIGWFLADLIGYGYWFWKGKKILEN